MTAVRQRRLLERARRSLGVNPQLCLDSVDQLLSMVQSSAELTLLKARALKSLQRYRESVALWQELLAQEPDNKAYALEALDSSVTGFDYASMSALLNSLVQPEPPQEEGVLVLCIRAAQALRQSELALQLCEVLVGLVPGNPVHRCKLGTFYQSFGRMEEAEDAFLAALAKDSDYQPGWYFLAQLRRWDVDQNHLPDLRGFLERQSLNDQQTSCAPAHFALAKEFEDLALYDDAFLELQQGSRQIRQQSAYHVDMDRQLFAQLRAWFDESGGVVEPGYDKEGPIFILGMPRTGSTLADRILSSHTNVSSVGELMCFRRAVEELCHGEGQSDFFASFFASAPSGLPYRDIGKRYMEMLAPLLGQERFFIDKMPMNYVFVGLIARALPRARFVHTTRNPMDTCFSNFKQMFGEGYYGYSYDLEDLAAHYLEYRGLMEFWQQQFPDRIYNLCYENMVAQPDQEIRSLLAWLDLDWQPACLEFHSSNTAVNTASVSQVRQPIYRGSVEKWRKFEKHLGPLNARLSAGVSGIANESE